MKTSSPQTADFPSQPPSCLGLLGRTAQPDFPVIRSMSTKRRSRTPSGGASASSRTPGHRGGGAGARRCCLRGRSSGCHASAPSAGMGVCQLTRRRRVLLLHHPTCAFKQRPGPGAGQQPQSRAHAAGKQGGDIPLKLRLEQEDPGGGDARRLSLRLSILRLWQIESLE